MIRFTHLFSAGTVAVAMTSGVLAMPSEPQLIDASEFDDRSRAGDPNAFDFVIQETFVSNDTFDSAQFQIFLDDAEGFRFAGEDDVLLTAVSLISSSRGTTIIDLTPETFGIANVIRLVFDNSSLIQPGEVLTFGFGFNGDVDPSTIEVFSAFSVPTPGTAALLGVAALAGVRRRR